MVNTNPQREQMSSEAMVETLSAQAEAIWPQEKALFSGYELPRKARIIDVGCGTGEITERLARFFPKAELLGIDIHAPHLERARRRSLRFGERIRFQQGDAFELPVKNKSQDLVVCRHLLQAVPRPESVLDELCRIAKPGGRLHLLVEDYGMIHFHPTSVNLQHFWRNGPILLGERMSTDMRGGRKVFGWLRERGLEQIALQYIIIDTLRVPRNVMARIWQSWRNCYSELLAEKTDLGRQEIEKAWEEMHHCTLSPAGYAVWFVPVATAVMPEDGK